MNPISPPAEPSISSEYQDQAAEERALLSLGSSEGQTMQHIFRLGKKYIWLVLVCALLGASIGVIQNSISPKEYSASADIEITANTADQFRLDTAGDYDDGYVDLAKLDTETAILKSSTLAVQTIRSLGLDQNKDFLPLGSKHQWDLSFTPDRHVLVGLFEGGLKVSRDGHTNILTLTFTSRNPKLAAEICNALIDNYVQHNFSDNYAATKEVSGWLQTQLGDLRNKLEASQERMLDAQKDLGLVGIDQTQSIVLSRLVELDHDATQAESERLMAEAKLLTLKSAPPDVLASLSADSLLTGLEQHLNELKAEASSLSVIYGNQNPRVKQIHSEMDEVTKAIELQRKNVVTRAEQEVDAAKRSEEAIRGRLDEEKDSAFQGNSKAVEYTLARREYESNRALYDGLQQRLQEAGIIAGLHSTDIRRIDPADAPDWPSAPNTRLNISFGLLSGLAIGFVLAFLIESLDTNIKTIFDIEERLGLPMLGIIPQVDAKQLSPQAFIDEATSSSPGAWSRLAEAFRAMRTTILLSRAGSPPKVILISSAKPSEGKTSIAVLEAIVFALNGSRVLLVDADLRRPSVHLRFKAPNKTGLTSVLTGKSSLEDALIKPPSLPTLDVLPSGPIAPMPAELLGSQQMQNLIQSARAIYDFILIDTPPVLTVTDAAVLVSVSDGVAMVLRYGEATRNIVARASEILLRAGARLLGVALNAVDLKSSDYAEYYGRAYNDYYQSRVDDE